MAKLKILIQPKFMLPFFVVLASISLVGLPKNEQIVSQIKSHDLWLANNLKASEASEIQKEETKRALASDPQASLEMDMKIYPLKRGPAAVDVGDVDLAKGDFLDREASLFEVVSIRTHHLLKRLEVGFGHEMK